MALEKSVEINNSGITAKYHKIFIVDLQSGQVGVNIYRSKAYRDSGKDPIHSVYVTIPLEELSIEKLDIKNPWAVSYDWYKATHLQGAIDV